MKLFDRVLNPREIRRRLGLNQEQFWTQIGVTQSGGSRYESGREMPKPVRERTPRPAREFGARPERGPEQSAGPPRERARETVPEPARDVPPKRRKIVVNAEPPRRGPKRK